MPSQLPSNPSVVLATPGDPPDPKTRPHPHRQEAFTWKPQGTDPKTRDLVFREHRLGLSLCSSFSLCPLTNPLVTARDLGVTWTSLKGHCSSTMSRGLCIPRVCRPLGRTRAQAVCPGFSAHDPKSKEGHKGTMINHPAMSCQGERSWGGDNQLPVWFCQGKAPSRERGSSTASKKLKALKVGFNL